MREQTEGHTSRLPRELWVASVMVVLIPASMETPWGAAGSYVCFVVTLLAGLAFLRLGFGFEDLRRAFPFGFVSIILVSTALAILRDGTLDLALLRGTPVQLSAFVSVYVLAKLWANRGGSLQGWVERMIFLCLPISFIAILEYLTGNYIEIDRLYSSLTGINLDDSTFRSGPAMFRAIATAGNPLILGTLAATWSCCAFGVYLTRPRLPVLIAFLMHSAAAFVSLSRSSWLALGVGVSVVLGQFVLAKRGLSQRHYLHAILLLIMAGPALLLYPVQNYLSRAVNIAGDQVATRMAGMEGSISYTIRISGPQAAFNSMLSEPETLLVGFGLGGENRYFLSSNPIMDQPIALEATRLRTFDNTYITIVYSFGIIGLCLFAILFIHAFQRIKRLDGILGLSHLGGTVALTVCIFFYNGLSAALVGLFLGLFLGAAGASDRIRHPITRRSTNARGIPSVRLERQWQPQTAPTKALRPDALGS